MPKENEIFTNNKTNKKKLEDLKNIIQNDSEKCKEFAQKLCEYIKNNSN